ncbi:MAG: hypothetical protein KBT03_08060 [Bacteroidales bacterium]|nr:hypothetical protein [Candidatus Scybalousia scybalohippi]
MGMIDWAKKEVELACKRENPNRKDGEFDYGCACYESALKAYKSICDDNHSGMSFGFTRNILIRLMDGNPLTPIEDTEDIWNEVDFGSEGRKSYQCKRKSALFKDVFEDGTVKYSDIDRCYAYNIETGCSYSSGLVRSIVDEMFPIAMPYVPEKPWKVSCMDFLTHKENGDFDTYAIFSIEKDNEIVNICRYFKCDEGIDNDWVEISVSEFEKRKSNRIK